MSKRHVEKKHRRKITRFISRLLMIDPTTSFVCHRCGLQTARDLIHFPLFMVLRFHNTWKYRHNYGKGCTIIHASNVDEKSILNDKDTLYMVNKRQIWPNMVYQDALEQKGLKLKSLIATDGGLVDNCTEFFVNDKLKDKRLSFNTKQDYFPLG